MSRTKVPKDPWNNIRAACKDDVERQQLADAIKAGWTLRELHEYARLNFHPTGQDRATPLSYRIALSTIAGDYGIARDFLQSFRDRGGVVAGPRDPSALTWSKRTPKLPPQFSRDWTGHTEAFRAEVDELAREYLRSKCRTPPSKMSDQLWKRVCHLHFELTES